MVGLAVLGHRLMAGMMTLEVFSSLSESVISTPTH